MQRNCRSVASIQAPPAGRDLPPGNLIHLMGNAKPSNPSSLRVSAPERVSLQRSRQALQQFCQPKSLGRAGGNSAVSGPTWPTTFAPPKDLFLFDELFLPQTGTHLRWRSEAVTAGNWGQEGQPPCPAGSRSLRQPQGPLPLDCNSTCPTFPGWPTPNRLGQRRMPEDPETQADQAPQGRPRTYSTAYGPRVCPVGPLVGGCRLTVSATSARALEQRGLRLIVGVTAIFRRLHRRTQWERPDLWPGPPPGHTLGLAASNPRPLSISDWPKRVACRCVGVAGGDQGKLPWRFRWLAGLAGSGWATGDCAECPSGGFVDRGAGRGKFPFRVLEPAAGTSCIAAVRLV